MSLILSAGISQAASVPSTQDVNECRALPSQRDQYASAEQKRINYELCIKIKLDEHGIEEMKAKVATSARTADNCLASRSESTTGIGGFWNGAMGWTGLKSHQDAADIPASVRAECANAQGAAAQQIDRMQKDLETRSRELKAAESNFNASTTAVVANASANRQTEAIVGNEFNSMKIAVGALMRENDQGAAKLDRIARALDNSALGIYLRDRMANLLNSKAMCDTIKSCPSGIKGKDLNAVFNSDIKMKTSEVQAAPATPAAAPANR